MDLWIKAPVSMPKSSTIQKNNSTILQCVLCLDVLQIELLRDKG